MFGLAEKQDGLAKRLRDYFNIGSIYTLDDIAMMLGWETQAAKGRGVVSPRGSDAQVLIMHLQKDEYSVQEYVDHLYGTTLFWSGQNRMKSAETALENKTKDTFIFIQNARREPYYYYGRAVPVRMQISRVSGIPSHIVFDLPEYAMWLRNRESVESEVCEDIFLYRKPSLQIPCGFDNPAFQKIRTAQKQYRKNVLKIWEHKCAVTGVDDERWLIASHIRPWRESTDVQRADPHNGLLLAPDYDKLFKIGTISFSPESGKIMLPDSLSSQMKNNLDRLHIDDTKKLRYLDEGVAEYLEYHNHYVYRFNRCENSCTEDFFENLMVRAFETGCD